MSQQIDNKVVSMDFDNQKFERGIRQSISSLDKLKASLDFSAAEDSFKKVETQANDIDFKGLQKAIDTVNYRFSAMGIAGAAAITNITNTIMSAGKKAYSTTIGLIKSGGKQRALNLEQARFQIEGLGKSWELLYEDMDYAVSGTAYGLDSAAKAASQLAASNVAAGDDMKAALRGISGLAAMTNSEYDDIANIFTTVAGNGRLMSEQLLQMSSRGLNAAAALATQLGVTEAEIRDMVSEGEIDFKTFSYAMDQAFGEHAKAANDTFTGALSNVKAALSRIGADVYTVQLENARKVLVKLIDVVNGFRKALNPLITILNDGLTRAADAVAKFLDSFDFSVWYAYADRANLFFKTTDQIADTAETATKSIKGLKKVVKAVMRGDYGNGQARKDALAAAGYDYEQIQSAVNAVMLQGKTLKEALSETNSEISESAESASVTVKKSVQDIANEIGEYEGKIVETQTKRAELEKTLTQQAEALTAAQATGVEATIEEAQKAYDATETLIEQADSEIEDYYDHIDQLGKQTEVENLEKVFNRLKYSADNIYNSAKRLVKIFSILKDQAGDALDQVFPNRDISKPILKLTQALDKLSTKGLLAARKNANKFQSVFKGAFSIISIGIKVIKALINAVSPLGKIFGVAGDSALNLSASAGEAIYQFDQWLGKTDALTKAFSPLKKALEVVGNVLQSFVGSMKTGFTGQMRESDKLVVQLGQHVGKFAKKIGDFFSTLLTNATKTDGAITDIKNGSSQTFKIIQNGFSKVSGVIKKLKITDFLDKVKEGLKDVFELISGFFGKNEAEDGLVTIQDEASATSASINETQSAFESFADSVGSRLNSVKEGLNSFKEKLEDVFGETIEINNGGDIIDVTKMGIALAILYKIQQATKTLWESSPSELIRNTSNAVSQLRQTLLAYQNELKAQLIVDVAKAAIFLAGAMLIVSMIPSNKLIPAAIAITAVTGALAFAVLKLANITTQAQTVSLQMGGLIAMFIGFGTAIAAIGIGFAGIGIGLGALTVAIVGLYNVIKLYAGMDADIWEAGFEKIKMVITSLGEFLAKGFLTGIGGKKGGVGVAIKLLALVGALWLLQHVLASYAKLDPKVFEVGMERISMALTQITSALVTTTLTGLATFGGFGLVGFAAVLYGYVGILKAIMKPIKAISEMDTSDIDKAINALKEILSTLGIFITSLMALTIAGKWTTAMKPKDMFGLAAVILAAASMVSIVTGAIKSLGSLDQSTLTQGIGVLTTALFIVAAFAAAVNISMRGVDAEHSGGLKGLSALTSVILAVVAAVIVLGNMPGEVLLKGVISLFFALGALAITVKGVGTAIVASQNTWSAILAFAALLLAIAGSLAILSQLKVGKMFAGVLALGVVLTFLAGFMVVFNKTAGNMSRFASSKGIILSMVAVILSLVAVTAAIAILAQFPAAKVVAAGTMISLLLGTIAAIIFIFDKFGSPGILASAATAALSIVEFVGIIIAVMSAIGGLSMLMEKFVGVSLADMVGYFMDIIVAIADGIGRAAEGIFGKEKDSVTIIDFIDSVRGVITAAKELDDIGDLASVFVAIAGGFAAVNFSNIFESINEAFGGESSLDRLEDFIDEMKDFIEDLNEFIAVGDINTYGVKNIATAINAFANIDVGKVGGFTQAFSGYSDYTGFTNFVDNIGPALQSLSKLATGYDTYITGSTVKTLQDGMDFEAIGQAIEAIGKLAEIDVPKTGILQAFAGKSDFTGFVTFIDSVGPALQSLSKLASGYDTYIAGSTAKIFQEGMNFDVLKQAIKAIGQLAEIDVPKASLFSVTDFGGFTTFISAIGPALQAMSEALTAVDTINYGSGFSVDVEKSALNVEAIKDAIGLISEIAKIELPKDNGLLGMIIGDAASTFDSFATSFPKLGEGLADFAEKLGEADFNDSMVSHAISMVARLANIDTKEIDGSSLTGLATAMNSIGPALHRLYTQVGEDNTYGVTYGKDTFSGFIDAMSSLSSITNLGQLNTLGTGLQAIVDSGIGKNTGELGAFKYNMTVLAEGLQNYSDTIKGISTSKIAAGADSLASLGSVDYGNYSVMGSFGLNLSDLATAVGDFIESVDTASISIALGGVENLLGMITDLEDANIDAIDDFGSALGTLGETGVTEFIEAFTSESSKTGARNALQVFVDSADDNINLTNITNAGKNVAQGFIDGMKSDEKLQAAYNAGVALANKAEEGAKSKKGADEHSPSKKFQKIGAYCVEGFTKALGNTSDVYKKGAALGLAALAGTNEALDIHSPSRKMYLTGTYAIKGLSNALADGAKDIDLRGKMIGIVLVKNVESAAKRVKRVTNILVQNVMKSMKTTKQVKKYAGEAVEAYVKAHGVSAKKASKAIGSMVENWYKGTDQYAEDKKNIKSNVKSLRQLLKTREETVKSHQKELKKLRKNGASKKEINQTLKQQKKELNEIDDAISDAQKSVAQSEADMAANIEAIWESATSAISDNLSNFLDILEVDFDAGIDLLSEFTSAYANTMSTLFSDYSGDDTAENYKESKKDLEEQIAAKKAELEYWKKMDEAVDHHSATYRDNIKSVTTELEELEKQMSELKTPQEEMLKNMSSNAEGIAEWRDNLAKLKAAMNSGYISADLYNYLIDLGLEGADTVQTFAEMTESELREANGYWLAYANAAGETMDDILDDMKKNNDETAEYQKSIAQLRAMGVSEGIIESLEALGTQGLPKIKAFLSATGEQIAQANAEYGRTVSANATEMINNAKKKMTEVVEWQANITALKGRLSATGLDENTIAAIMGDVLNKGVDYNDALETILGMDDAQLAEYMNNVGAALTIPETVAQQTLSQFTDIGDKAGQTFYNHLTGNTDGAGTDLITGTSDAANAAADTDSSEDDEEGGGTKKAGRTMARSFAKGIINVLKKYGDPQTKQGKKMRKAARSIGRNIVQGVKKGIENNAPQTVEAVNNLGDGVINALKTRLGIASPSKEFALLGQFADMGLAKGLKYYASLATAEATAVGDETVDALATAMSYLPDATEMEDNPVIAPVVDLTDVRAKAQEINYLLGQRRIASLEAANYESSIRAHRQALSEIQNGLANGHQNIDQSTETNNYNIYVTGNNPREIAQEVSRVIQEQVDRRQSVWA